MCKVNSHALQNLLVSFVVPVLGSMVIGDFIQKYHDNRVGSKLPEPAGIYAVRKRQHCYRLRLAVPESPDPAQVQKIWIWPVG
jgi:hypothetical protein